MSFRSVKVPPNSASLIEAKGRVFNFFRTACRSFATVMDIYNLDEVVTKAQLCSSIASQIRCHENIVGYYSSWFESEQLYIQMELCNCSLSTKKSSKGRTEGECWKYFIRFRGM